MQGTAGNTNLKLAFPDNSLTIQLFKFFKKGAIMKKLSCFFLLLFFASFLYAEEEISVTVVHSSDNVVVQTSEEIQPAEPAVQSENPADEQQNEAESPVAPHFVQFKFGLGADFDGVAGRPIIEEARYAMLRNQLGISLGFDFGWIVFQQTEGKGAGDLCLGFGFDFQYWVPTEHMSPDNRVSSSHFDEINYIYSHYMRAPVTLNISYEFKVNAGAIRRVGPLFSIGMNNNIFYFSYSTDNESEQKSWDYRFDKEISHWKVSGTWELGIGMVFENNWILNASIGGDFGSQNIRSYLLYGKTGLPDKYVYTLYDHHEFLMFETGYRF